MYKIKRKTETRIEKKHKNKLNRGKQEQNKTKRIITMANKNKLSIVKQK